MKNLHKGFSEILSIELIITSVSIRSTGIELSAVSPVENSTHNLFHGRIIIKGMCTGQQGQKVSAILHDS